MQPIPGVLFIEQMQGPMVDASEFGGTLWENICTLGVAQSILAKVKAIPGVQNVQMAVEHEPFAMVSLMPGLALYNITGTDAAGLPIDEYAGDLASRETTPEAPIDGTGGPNLKIRDFASENYCQVYWGN